MKNILLHLLVIPAFLFLALLPACVGKSPGPVITAEQAASGAEYLTTSVASLQKALDISKSTGDPARVDQAQAILDKAQSAAQAFKASVPTASSGQWDAARSLLSTAVDTLAPIAMQALVAGGS